MKKIKLIAILTVFILVFSLAACGKKAPTPTPDNNNKKQSENSEKKNQSENNEKKNVPDNNNSQTHTPAEIEQAIAKALGTGYLCTKDVDSEELFTSAIGFLDLEKVKSYVAKQALVSSVSPDSIVVAEVADGYADEAVSLINEFYAGQVEYTRQYPFSVAKVDGARLYRYGNILIFVIAGADAGENATAEQAAQLSVSEYEKIDNAIKALFGSLPENLANGVLPEDNGNVGDDNGLPGGDTPIVGG